MLSPHEFTVGTLAEAEPLSLMLPRTKYERTVLIGTSENGPAAVVLEGGHRFRSFECRNATNWTGLLIPNVRVEVDETSLLDPGGYDAPFGAVVRSDTRLLVYAQ